MTDGEALYDAILANPHEDTPRLMYADWLDERGSVHECGACSGEGKVDYCSRFMYSCAELGVVACDCGSKKVCETCSGSGQVSNSNAERADFIRRQIADPTLNVDPWIRYFKDWFSPILEGHGSYSFNSKGGGCIQFGNNDMYVQVDDGFITQVKSQWEWLTTPNNAARLFTQPISKVMIVDSGYLGVANIPGVQDAPSSWVGSHWPSTLRRALGSDPRLERLYDTKAEAEQTLSDVCVDWGRKQYLTHYTKLNEPRYMGKETEGA